MFFLENTTLGKNIYFFFLRDHIYEENYTWILFVNNFHYFYTE